MTGLQQRIVRELRVWSRVRHENIVPLLGLWIEYKRFPSAKESIPCPVAPWMGCGNLQTYLEEKPNLPLIDRFKIVSPVSLLYNKSLLNCDCLDTRNNQRFGL